MWVYKKKQDARAWCQIPDSRRSLTPTDHQALPPRRTARKLKGRAEHVLRTYARCCSTGEHDRAPSKQACREQSVHHRSRSLSTRAGASGTWPAGDTSRPCAVYGAGSPGSGHWSSVSARYHVVDRTALTRACMARTHALGIGCLAMGTARYCDGTVGARDSFLALTSHLLRRRLAKVGLGMYYC